MKKIKKTLAVVGAAAALAVSLGAVTAATANAAENGASASSFEHHGGFATKWDCEKVRVAYIFGSNPSQCQQDIVWQHGQTSPTWYFNVN